MIPKTKMRCSDRFCDWIPSEEVLPSSESWDEFSQNHKKDSSIILGGIPLEYWEGFFSEKVFQNDHRSIHRIHREEIITQSWVVFCRNTERNFSRMLKNLSEPRREPRKELCQIPERYSLWILKGTLLECTILRGNLIVRISPESSERLLQNIDMYSLRLLRAIHEASTEKFIENLPSLSESWEEFI